MLAISVYLTIILYAFILVIAVVCIGLVTVLLSSAIVFSRIAFALLCALITVQNSDIILVTGSGFLNFSAWTIVYIGIIFLLSLLPNVDISLRFFCTVFISIYVITMVVLLIGSLITGNSPDRTFELTTTYEILIKIVCLILAFIAVENGRASRKYLDDAPRNGLMIQVERILSSCIIGITTAFLSVSINGNWPENPHITLAIWIVVGIAAYIIDTIGLGKSLTARLPIVRFPRIWNR